MKQCVFILTALTTLCLAGLQAWGHDPCVTLLTADKTDLCVGQTGHVTIVSETIVGGVCDVLQTNFVNFVTNYPGTYILSNQCTACDTNHHISRLTIHVSDFTNLSPSTVTMCLGSFMEFTAIANPTNATCAPTWTLDPSDAGTLTINGRSAAFSLSYTCTNSIVILSAYCGSSGTNSATIYVSTNTLEILSQPSPQIICTGQATSLSVSAIGNSLTYQWRKDGIDIVDGSGISGATSATLTISNAQLVAPVCRTLPPSSSGLLFSNVTAYETYLYEADGCVSGNLEGTHRDNPDGNDYTNFCTAFVSYPPTASSGFTCPGLKSWSLVGKVNGTCIQMGTTGSFVAPSSGPLTLYFNDDIYSDNSGTFSVCVGNIDGQYDVVIGSDCGFLFSEPVTVALSTPCDGIPDWWRQKYFGDGTTTNSNTCASCSYIGDGVSNLTKYLEGRDPTKSGVSDSSGLVDLSVFTPLE